MELGGKRGCLVPVLAILSALPGCFHSPIFLDGLVVLSMPSHVLGTSQMPEKRGEEGGPVHVRTNPVELQERACHPREGRTSRLRVENVPSDGWQKATITVGNGRE